MFRTFRTATLLAMTLLAACKKTDKPAGPAPEATTKAPEANAKPPEAMPAAAEPGKPGDTAVKAGTPPEGAKAGSDWDKPVDPPKPEAAGQNSALEAKGVDMMQKLADVFASDVKDCEKLATDIKAFVAQNKPLLGELVAMEKSATPEQKAAFSSRNAAVQTAVAGKMQPAIAACGQNANVQAAMKTFPSE